MRKLTLITLTLLLTTALALPPATAQEDSTRWELPESETLRLGKCNINELAYSPDGKLLAVASSIGVWLYDAQTYQERAVLTGHTDGVLSVAFSPDGQTLASGSRDDTVRLWDVATGTLQQTLTHTGSVPSVAFSPDGRTLASGVDGWTGTIYLWDVATGKLQDTLPSHKGGLSSVAFSPDGQTLASVGGWDALVSLWDVATGTFQQTLAGHTYLTFVRSVAFSPDGSMLAGAGGWRDKTVRLWDVATGMLQQTLAGHTDIVESVVFSLDSRTLASGSIDATVRLWDVATGTLQHTLTEYTSGVLSVAFSPDGRTLASGSDDGMVFLWDIASVASETSREDINGDGVVNIQDLTLVAAQLGQMGEDMPADINGDGVVNIQDLVLVAGAFEAGAAAPSARAVSRAHLTVSDVEGWLIEARAVSFVGQERPILTSFSPQTHLLSGSGSGDPELQSGNASRPGGLSYLRGIAVLEQLLANLIPKETALLANYPNSFNPETWIPYQLSEPAEVTVTIYAANGAVVRRLDLGHRRAGSYDSRDRAAYWDGRNAQGESVSSGVYFYTLSAGDFKATRKMVIRK